jgi:hypothetical protein
MENEFTESVDGEYTYSMILGLGAPRDIISGVQVEENEKILPDQTVITGSRAHGLNEYPLQPTGICLLTLFSDILVKTRKGGEMVFTPGGANIKLSWKLTRILTRK